MPLLPPLRNHASSSAGFALIEVLVSAVILLIVSAGVFAALSANARTAGFERDRARAQTLAEQELEQVRSLRIADLTSLNRTRTVTQDGETFTVTSTSRFLTETATTSTCSSGGGSRDYMQLNVSVSWQNMAPHTPVTASTIVTPPSGSFVPNSGALLVQIDNAAGNGISGVNLSGSGPASFSGTTGSTGCVLWRNLPAGTYTVTASGVATGMVDPDGNPPTGETTSVVDQGTNTLDLTYDRPGSISNVTFRTRDYSNALVTSATDSITVSNTGMQVAKTFNTTGNVQATSIGTTSTLYPFTSTYAVFAGRCGSNNPNAAGTMLGNALVPAGGAGTLQTPGYIQLPSAQVTVYSGTTTSSSRVSGAKVYAHDRDPSCNVIRELTPSAGGTNTSGQVPEAPPTGGDIGLPYGTYDICATNAARTAHRTVTPVALTTAGTTGTPVNVFLGSGTTSGTACP